MAVLDLRLPGLDGLQILNAVVRDGLPSRVLFLSASGDGEVVYRAVQMGAAGYFRKEADREAILDAIAAVARGRTVIDPELQAGVFEQVRLRGTGDDRPILTDRGRDGRRQRRRRLRDSQRHGAPVAQQLIADGKVQHAYMGVQAETIPSGVSRLVRGIPGAGVTIASVRPGSPAAKAGLKAATSQVTADGQTALLGGDSITALDGKPIRSARASPARSPPTGRASASASRSCGGRRRGPSR